MYFLVPLVILNRLFKKFITDIKNIKNQKLLVIIIFFR
jgi:hypothetical protein